ncbi:hypothetical protein PHYBOEH_000236 [Phytophthora boehmeriae]|uniref:Man1/Src1-like C-terminal domain-containing protein n=1 Tax=Phytophthora boehmeriae TaxID=109152 RepID=A0A8T1WUG1_9STRA|nr:hypothetical protein PHYBOEH_000236 [Phytophthora boehmeriae]
MDELASPVTSLRRRQQRERQAQQERLAKVSTSTIHRSNPTKRKPTAVAAESSTNGSKRRRKTDPSASSVVSSSHRPYTKTTTSQTRSTASGTSTSQVPAVKSTLLKQKKPEKKSISLFSRLTDPTVCSPAIVKDISATSAPGGTESYATKYKLTGESLLQTPPSKHERLQEQAATRLTSSGGAEGVVDLDAMEHVGELEMVEGNDILQALMKTSTPRLGRQFPSEEALTNSEKRDREVVRRRRMKLRSQYSAMKLKPQKNDDVEFTGENADFMIPTRSLGFENGLFQPTVCEKEPMKVEAKDVIETGKSEERARLEEEEAETDEETTESKINRLSNAMHLNWKHFFLWLVSGSLLLCVIVVAAPFVMKMLEPPLPYCDSEWSEGGDGSYVLADPADHFDRSKALQPFIATDAVSANVAGPTCQPCPVYGNCLNGAVISCAPPYELQHSLCVENPQVQEDLDKLSLDIQQFVVDKAARNACDNMSLWSYVATDSKSVFATGFADSVEVLLSDVQVFVTRTISFGKAVAKMPREYVFNRALDMALRALKYIFVTEDQRQLVVGRNVVPWSCRAKHQLYSHVKLIALAVALGTALVFGYRQFLLYRAERQLVDRFVKEVRFFLLDRTRKSERFYPADHLRDDLLDKQYPRDHKWLRKSVWPKVVAIVNGDSRVRSSVKRVQGEELIVWEWISSISPSFRRGGGGRGLRGPSRPHPSGANVARSKTTQIAATGTRQRKKPGRMSLPMSMP